MLNYFRRENYIYMLSNNLKALYEYKNYYFWDYL